MSDLARPAVPVAESPQAWRECFRAQIAAGTFQNVPTAERDLLEIGRAGIMLPGDIAGPAIGVFRRDAAFADLWDAATHAPQPRSEASIAAAYRGFGSELGLWVLAN